jgi:hypothetical protein
VTTLTDRYVWAVVRNLPESDRDGVDLELRDLIAGMVDSRDTDPAAGPEDDAEREVLAELGNPNRLAARYVARPRALIGAGLFPEYVRVLKLVWLLAVPLVTAIALLSELLDEPSVGGVIGMVIASVYGGTVLVTFWVTLVYAALDRSNYQSDWTPDALPAAPRDPAAASFSVGDAVFGLVVIALTATALVWQQVSPPLDDAAGDGVPFLDPDLWNGAGQALLGLLGASFLVSAVALTRRRWTLGLAAANAAVDVAFFVIVAWLALDERLINEVFLETLADRADWDTVPTVNPWLIVAVAGAIEAWDIIEAFVRARRQRG